MKDSTFIELLNLYVDHQISPADATRLEEEVRGNPERRRVYRQYCQIQKACTSLGDAFRTEAPAPAATPQINDFKRRRRVIGFAADGATVAALAVNGDDPLRYLEVIGQGQPLERRPLPSLAIPTTAGTGSEVTRNAVLTSPEHGVKVSLRHPWMLPAVALVDPRLALGLPPAITASTGLDALTQLIEPYLSNKANPVTDALALEGIRRAVRSLRRAWAEGGDLEAREDMALASLLGGLALANAGLGAVHGLAAPLGGLRPVPHGVACAALLPHVLAANLAAAQPQGPLMEKFRTLARTLTGEPRAIPADGVRWVQELVAALAIPGLGHYGLMEADLERVAELALAASSMKANPVPLDRATLMAILARAS